jgi:deferrochelatase/peroxidase EfeB
MVSDKKPYSESRVARGLDVAELKAMNLFRAKKAAGGTSTETHSLARLEFEMALELGDGNSLPSVEAVREAAQAAGGDVVLSLPTPDGQGVSAVVRLVENGHNQFVQVRSAETGFAVLSEGQIDTDLLGFARTSVEVLERLKADSSVLAPLAAV